jgi:hypothetical protein
MDCKFCASLVIKRKRKATIRPAAPPVKQQKRREKEAPVMSFNFKTSLKHGALGELIFYEAHCGEMKKEDGRARDFTYTLTGDGVELKTDLWSMEKTPNFFFERYSDKQKQSPGGPWQAQANGNKWFVYFYVSNMTYFRFETSELVECLNKVIPDIDPTDVKNSSWTTEGYRVPRDRVSHIAEEFRLKTRVVPSKKKKKLVAL